MTDFQEENWLERVQVALVAPEIVPGVLLSDGELEMKMFIDCEFNGMGGQLLSIALVPEDEQFEPFYREHAVHEPIDAWVQQIVMPKMKTCGCFRSHIQADLMAFLGQYDRIHLVADWPDDIKYFCELLITGPGERIDTPPLTMEIRRDLDCDSKNPHHALADATAMRDRYLELQLTNRTA